MLFNKGTVGRGKGSGEVRGVQYTANQGQEWTGIHSMTQRRDFQVSKEDFSRREGAGFLSRNGVARKGLRACTFMYILC
jgi:hypothetical protein